MSAVAIVHGYPWPEALSNHRMLDPLVYEVAKKIKFKSDPELSKSYPAKLSTRVTILTKDGKKYSHEEDNPKGDPSSPLTDEDLKQKMQDAGVLAPPEVWIAD